MDWRLAGGETILLRKPGKKTVKIELFPAVRWQGVPPYGKQKMTPKPTHDQRWWKNRVRLMIDGKWHRENGHKYSFYTRAEVFQLLARIPGENKCLD
jgi:hypothetical protein